jgi:hypothetical protein
VEECSEEIPAREDGEGGVKGGRRRSLRHMRVDD